MFSPSQKIRRRAFFSIWKEGIHPISDLSADIKRLLYPQLRGCVVMSKDEFYVSESIPDWIGHGSREIQFCLEQSIQQTTWNYKNTEVHALMVHQMLFFIWVDISNPSDINELIQILNFQLIKDCSNDKHRSTWQLIVQFGAQKLQDRGTYVVAGCWKFDNVIRSVYCSLSSK